jgi:hypothetical protein
MAGISGRREHEQVNSTDNRKTLRDQEYFAVFNVSFHYCFRLPRLNVACFLGLDF